MKMTNVSILTTLEHRAGDGLGSRPCSAWVLMGWPDEEFKVWDDGNPHGNLYLVLPGGQMVSIACHADYATDLLRAEWIRDSLNIARLTERTN